MPPKSEKAQNGFAALVLSEKGDVNQVTIPAKGSTSLTIANIKTYLKKKTVPECIGTYPYKQLTLFLFGQTDGPEGTENQHQLPPPHDSTTIYGDIVLIASKDENLFNAPVAFKPDDYEQFYTKSFGGIDMSDEDEDADDAADADLEDAVDAAADEIDEPIEEGKEFAEDDAEDSDEDEDEDADVEANVIVEDDTAEVAPVAKAKAKKRKAPAKATVATLSGTTTAYPDKPTVSEEKQLQEETTVSPLTDKPRLEILKALHSIFKTTLTVEQIEMLESSIYSGSVKEARRRHIIRVWSYPLFTHFYKMYARHIISNFNPDTYVQNKELFQLFKEGNITIQSISEMNTYELYPSRWKAQFDSQQVREKNQLEGNRSMATDQFVCKRCWKRECTYYEMQTRSADEPMTIFITCLNCGKHWRQ